MNWEKFLFNFWSGHEKINVVVSANIKTETGYILTTEEVGKFSFLSGESYISYNQLRKLSPKDFRVDAEKILQKVRKSKKPLLTRGTVFIPGNYIVEAELDYDYKREKITYEKYLELKETLEEYHGG